MYLNRLLRQNIFLIGDMVTQIIGNKLPSKKQVLKVLFFNMRELNMQLRENATLVIQETLIFWKKAGLITRRENKCIKLIEDLYDKWRSIQKSTGKPFNIENEKKFILEINNLFDIAASDIFDLIDKKKIFFT